MQYTPALFDLQSAKIALGLLELIDEKKITGMRLEYVNFALWYYISPFDILPDILPGIGFMDDYVLLNTAMWLCGPRIPEIQGREVPIIQERIKRYIETIEPQPIEKTPVEAEIEEVEE